MGCFMFRTILAVLLALVLAAAVSAQTSKTLKSIAVLEDQHPDGTRHETCTAWAAQKDGVVRWVTAAHCIVKTPSGMPAMNIRYYIGGKEATLLAVNFTYDLAMFMGGPDAPGLKVALGEASFGQDVYTFGYFFERGVLTRGTTSVPAKSGEAVFGLGAGPGASGAPIMTKGDIVVGVVRRGPCGSPCPALAAVPVKGIRAFLFGE